MIDPVLSLLARMALALLFAAAAYHKAKDLPRFTAILADYRVLPSRLAGFIAYLVVAIEVSLAMTLLFPVTTGPLALAAPMGAALLLFTYSLAIAINLARGRREIDCGCGGEADQKLRPGLLARNALLMSVALAAGLPVSNRPLVLFDAVTLALGLMTLVLMWRASGQLASFPVPVFAHRRSSPS